MVLATPFGTTDDEQFQLLGANPTGGLRISLCLAVLLGRSELKKSLSSADERKFAMAINVPAPHARRLLTHGCEMLFSAQVPDGNEAKAQLVLDIAVTLEKINMQLERKGLKAALNFGSRRQCTGEKSR